MEQTTTTEQGNSLGRQHPNVNLMPAVQEATSEVSAAWA
jgi:hypothetical protein